ncbi:MAG TPA: nucleotidyltransferase domain-containing protein, partial [Accumulibacter sp.]|nr:nucleotidyltransferase domain-containing protein [Accumulibacter sp.]
MSDDLVARQALLSSFRSRLQGGQAAIREGYLTDGDAARLLTDRCRLIDECLCALWQGLKLPASLSLVAVGGYGRGELFPASDVDLLVLLPSSPDASLTAQLEQAIALLYDSRLDVAPSVRTVDECVQAASGDLTIQTALLETRLLTGSPTLYHEFLRRLQETIDPQAFFEAKRKEQEERHLRFHDSPYSLEPNFKEAPGGLRDLQTVLWVTRAAGYGNTWHDLARQGFLTAEEEEVVLDSVAFLRQLRVRLHLHVGRREDRLLFDYQTTLAEQMGYVPTPTRRASERLMQEYYRTAKRVTQINAILLLNVDAAMAPPDQQGAQRIDEHFQNRHDVLDVVDEDIFNRKPALLLEAFLVMQKHPELQGMSARTLRALWHARTLIDEHFRRDPANRACFLQLLQQDRGVVHEFRRMNQFGILGRYLPSFGQIVGQMQHDLFHVYTVDQHMLRVLRNLRRFMAEDFTHEYPLCSELIRDFPRPWV